MYEVAVNAPSDLLTSSKVSYYRDSYFFKARPQYEDLSVSDIINVKDYGATGDGVTDDTAAVKSALADATTSNLVYFPAGSYIITNGITIQPGTRESLLLLLTHIPKTISIFALPQLANA